MRGLGLAIMAAVFLVIVAVGTYVVKSYMDDQAKQLAKEKLIHELPADWQEYQKQLPDTGVEGTLAVNYPDVTFNMTLVDVSEVIILDTSQTEMLDKMLFKQFCSSILEADRDNNMDTRLAFEMMKEDRMSITAIFNNAKGYQIYRKRLYVTDCPQFEQLYKEHVK